MSTGDLLDIARAGGSALALSLLLVLIALQWGWLELGSAARREREFWRAFGEQMRKERDDYKAQVDTRQNVTDMALELAAALRAHRRRQFNEAES